MTCGYGSLLVCIYEFTTVFYALSCMSCLIMFYLWLQCTFDFVDPYLGPRLWKIVMENLNFVMEKSGKSDEIYFSDLLGNPARAFTKLETSTNVSPQYVMTCLVLVVVVIYREHLNIDFSPKFVCSRMLT